MIDKDCLLRDGSTALVSTEAAAAGVDFRGPDKEARTYMVHVPAITGTPTLDVKIQESDDNGTWRDFLAFPQITAVGQYFVSGKSNARYRRYVATVGGGTPNLGNTIIGPVPGGRYTNW